MITRSLCPTCYREIPAEIAVGEHVWMLKECPDHGRHVAMVERDPRWFLFVKRLGKHGFYPGYITDVTSRCQLKCRYCFHDNTMGGDRPIDEIMHEVVPYASERTIILTGGEPTLHPCLSELIRQIRSHCGVVVLTNGIKMADPSYFDELADAGLRENDTMAIALSFHRESAGKEYEVLELARSRGLKLFNTFFVVDSLPQIDEALSTFRKWRDVIFSMRVMAASNVWCEKKAPRKIFVSDMLRYAKKGENSLRVVLGQGNNKMTMAHTDIDGMHVMFVSWQDINNVDLDELDGPPYCQALDGKAYNFGVTGIVNEGIAKCS